MSESPNKKQDFIELAKHQFSQVSAEFEKALEALKDPERRKELTSSYLDMLQKGLAKAQDSVARYQEKVAPHETTSAPEDLSRFDAPPADPMPPAPEEPRGPEGPIP